MCSVPVNYYQVDEDGTTVYGTMSSVDHPSFAALRDHLGHRGYIEIQRGWHNGDVVLTDFMLNGRVFKQGGQFSSGTAMGCSFKFEQERLYSDGYGEE